MLPPTPPDLEPLSSDELAAVPLFPLPRMVLLPGGVLPLHVFEPRYRTLMSDCLAQGPRAIAMVMLAPGWESAYAGSPAIHHVAGVGRIVAHRHNADGTYDLVLQGLARVRLEERRDLDRAYRVARASVIEDEDGDDERASKRSLEPVLATASALASLERDGPRNAPSIDLAGSPGRVIDRIADRWIHDAATRQEVLETANVPHRIARVRDALASLLARLSTPPTSGGSIPPPN